MKQPTLAMQINYILSKLDDEKRNTVTDIMKRLSRGAEVTDKEIRSVIASLPLKTKKQVRFIFEKAREVGNTVTASKEKELKS